MEDNEEVRQLLRRILAGSAILIAALLACEAHRPNVVVLMDICMPHVDGLKAAKQILKRASIRTRHDRL